LGEDYYAGQRRKYTNEDTSHVGYLRLPSESKINVLDAAAGAAQAGLGVEQNYQLEVGANRMVYMSQIDAAGQTRAAGMEAASLRQAAAVIAAVGREISREVGQGMRIRF
jgi:hypothetical protein